MQVKKQQLEPYMEQLTGSKLGKEYDKAVYYHLAYLSCMQCTSWETQAGVKMAGRNNNFRYADDTTLMVESEEELKSLLMRVKEESKKAGLKLNIKKKTTTKIMVSSSMFPWQIRGKSGDSDSFSFLGLHNHCKW